jgi:hypothetical protein
MVRVFLSDSNPQESIATPRVLAYHNNSADPSFEKVGRPSFHAAAMGNARLLDP